MNYKERLMRTKNWNYDDFDKCYNLFLEFDQKLKDLGEISSLDLEGKYRELFNENYQNFKTVIKEFYNGGEFKKLITEYINRLGNTDLKKILK